MRGKSDNDTSEGSRTGSLASQDPSSTQHPNAPQHKSLCPDGIYNSADSVRTNGTSAASRHAQRSMPVEADSLKSPNSSASTPGQTLFSYIKDGAKSVCNTLRLEGSEVPFVTEDDDWNQYKHLRREEIRAARESEAASEAGTLEKTKRYEEISSESRGNIETLSEKQVG